MSIPQRKVDELKTTLDEEGYEIVFKPDVEEWPTWWLKVIYWFVWFLGLFFKEVDDNFREDFGQGLFGYILLPWSEEEFDFHDEDMYAALRHEVVHLRDQRRFHILFVLTYFLPPALITLRAYWELRGYAQNMIVEYEQHGYVSDGYLDWIEHHMTGPTYLWMFVYQPYVRTRLEKLRSKIEREEISGHYPNIGLTA